MILAPMQGLTELLFRRAYERRFPGAIAVAVAPFISLTHGNVPRFENKALADVNPDANRGSIPIIPQILGNEPDEFVAMAARLAQMGYDEVNWNLGCPMRRIAAKHRGSGLLAHPDEVRRILDAVVPRLPVRLSVKVRLGHCSPDEIYALIPVLNDYPLASVTLHPRTGKQQYSGHPQLEHFARALPLIDKPVIYNGDIFTLADYRTVVQRFTGIADVMIGRGVLYDPLLPLRIKGTAPQSDEEALRLCAGFVEDLVGDILRLQASDAVKLSKIKEYWCLLYKALHVPETEARALLRTPTLGEMTEAVLCISSKF